MNDTIAAIATPPGMGAIAILRISGPEAMAIAEQLFQGIIPVSKMEPRHQYVGKIVHAGKVLDEVLLTIFRAPKSYTGEESVEISGHGGALLIARLLKAVLNQGARMARPGEFTQRAYLNGKIDLTQAEAIMDLISAQTERAQRVAMEQLSGRLAQEIEVIKKKILSTIAALEAFLDFPEEDIPAETTTRLQEHLQSIRNHLTLLLSTADEGRLLRQGISIALCGAPNVGKSSLLNHLLGMERAIVSPLAGTTRDTIEETAILGGFPFRLIDTAGVRSTDDPIEQEGVLRAQRSAAAADLCLHLVDATMISTSLAPVVPEELLVVNKVDLLNDGSLLNQHYPEAVAISCVTGEGIQELITQITKRITQQHSTMTETVPSLLAINARHQVALEKALKATQQALAWSSTGSLELLAKELHDALEALGEVTGVVDREEILGEIFDTFCIGK